MTTTTPQATETLLTHHCRECGEEVEAEGFCAKHPSEIVDTVASVHPLRVAVNKAETDLRVAREACEALEEQAQLSGEYVDTVPAERTIGHAEGALEAAREALTDSDCPREWDLAEDGFAYQTVTAASAEEALQIAVDNCDRANYSESEGTLYIEVSATCEETGETKSETVTLDEPEPDCPQHREHDWQSPHALVGGLTENPGVHGKGGGVLVTEVCRHCGCKRVTDTWAQNPTTGEQGLRSVTYERDAYSTEELEEAFGGEAEA